MKILVERKGFTLVPVDKSNQDLIEELKHKTWYRCEIKKIRNPKFHAKFFKLLTHIVENSDFYTGMPKSMGVENLLNRVKFATGHYETYKIGDTMLAKTKSISFEKMDNLKFEEFYNGAVAAIILDEELGITELGDF